MLAASPRSASTAAAASRMPAATWSRIAGLLIAAHGTARGSLTITSQIEIVMSQIQIRLPRRGDVSMRALAAWCVRHRRLVVAGWLLGMVLITALAKAAGSEFSNSFSLPGTGSTAATDLLTAASPGVAGDQERVVVETSGG